MPNRVSMAASSLQRNSNGIIELREISTDLAPNDGTGRAPRGKSR